MKQAMRSNDGKTELTYLLDAPNACNGVCQVFMFGAKKYERNNWRRGMPYKMVADSLLRHLSAFLSGENNDPESQLPHVDHMLCNAMFLAEYYRSRPEYDDRFGMCEAHQNITETFDDDGETRPA